MTDILGPSQVTSQQAAAYARRLNATNEWLTLVDLYWSIAYERAGVRPEVAFTQACKETGFGKFGRAVTPAHHNPCGLKVRDPSGMADDDPHAHQTFPDWKTGVTAHIDHLALYAGARGYPRTDTPDPRHFADRYGIAPTVEALSGNWAPSRTYGAEIVDMINEMRGNVIMPPKLGDSSLVSYYRQARNYRAGGNLPVDRVVIHDMEYPERPGGAKWCADFFGGSGAPVASAHYCIDNQTIAQSVRESDIAFHAPPNSHSIGIEHAGYAAQTRAEWLDAYSMAELRLSARLTADICQRHNLPVVYLTAADLRAGKRGITTHWQVSMAFKRTDHHDPGPNFPMDSYLQWVKEAMGGGGGFLADLSTDEQKELLRAARMIGFFLFNQDPAKPWQFPGRPTQDEIADIKARLGRIEQKLDQRP